MTKAEIFFANRTSRKPSRDNSSPQPVLAGWLKGENSTPVENGQLLQMKILGCKSLRGFTSLTVACWLKRESERFWGQESPIGKCLLISCGRSRGRLTRNGIISQVTGVPLDNPSPSAAKYKRLILHTTISRGQYFFLPNRVRFLKLFLAFWSGPGKGE